MRTASSRRRQSPLRWLSFLVAALIAATLTSFVTLWVLGWVDLPFLKKKLPVVAEAPAKPTGIPVILSPKAIPAYTKITRESVLDPKTNLPLVRYCTQEEVDREGFVAYLGPLLSKGWVLKRDKAAGYAFRVDDFFPEGTRPGVVSAIPAGKRAFVLAADKIQGIHLLKAGDHFDLIGTMPVDFDKALARFHPTGLADPLLAASGPADHLPKRASVQVLVKDGIVVLPVTTREVPIESASRSKGGPPPTRPVQEITIAVDAEREVSRLTEAVATHAEMICVARTGQPAGSWSEKETRPSVPEAPLRTVEVITGNKRQVLLFSKPGEGPQELTPAEPAVPSAPKAVPPQTIPVDDPEAPPVISASRTYPPG